MTILSSATSSENIGIMIPSPKAFGVVRNGTRYKRAKGGYYPLDAIAGKLNLDSNKDI
ncbi:hypothetical protein BH09BAC3_BH09BAC3_25990 [soil metagenome]